jgi:threonine/homoserine/homoserine lactone efflux protein
VKTVTFELWSAFVVAAAVLLAIPGPTVMLVIGFALSHGRRSAWETVPGVALGDLTSITLSLVGLGAVLSASAVVFTLVKWIGAAYLIYLGLRMWSANPDLKPARDRHSDARGAMFRQAWTVTTLNPKSIMFFVAFLPQFIVSGSPVVPQMVTLGGTFVVLAGLNAAFYAVLAGSIRSVARRPSVLKVVNRVGGSILIGAGIVTSEMVRMSS